MPSRRLPAALSSNPLSALVLALVATLALAAAPAEAAGPTVTAAAPAALSPAPPAASALGAQPQLKELCASLERTDSMRFTGDPGEISAARAAHEARRAEALGGVYRVEVPSKGFAFGHVRADRDEVELDGDQPLRAFDDALALDLAGIDDVAFHAGAATLADWSKQKKAGQLALVVTFRPDDERCAGSPIARHWRLGGKPLWWAIVDAAGATLAAADEQGKPVEPAAARATAAAGALAFAASPPSAPAPVAAATPRSLVVESLSLDAEGADEGRARLEGASPALDRCAAAAQRLGSLVVAFGLQAGRLRDPQVVMDGTRDEQLAACVARALAGASVTGGGSGTGRGTVTLGVR